MDAIYMPMLAALILVLALMLVLALALMLVWVAVWLLDEVDAADPDPPTQALRAAERELTHRKRLN